MSNETRMWSVKQDYAKRALDACGNTTRCLRSDGADARNGRTCSALARDGTEVESWAWLAHAAKLCCAAPGARGFRNK